MSCKLREVGPAQFTPPPLPVLFHSEIVPHFIRIDQHAPDALFTANSNETLGEIFSTILLTDSAPPLLLLLDSRFAANLTLAKFHQSVSSCLTSFALL